MKKLTLVSLLALAALLLSISTAFGSESKTTFQALLSGEVEIPAVSTDAHGNAVVVFSDDNSELQFKLAVNGLDNTLMAHIHVAPAPGTNGPIVLWLYPSAPPPQLIAGTFNGLLGTGSATEANLTGAAGITSFAQLRAAIAEGRAYVNVHTTANPSGEIRGILH